MKTLSTFAASVTILLTIASFIATMSFLEKRSKMVSADQSMSLRRLPITEDFSGVIW